MHLGRASCYGGQNHFLGRREISEYQIERIQLEMRIALLAQMKPPRGRIEKPLATQGI
jgi:hypothetical protein